MFGCFWSKADCAGSAVTVRPGTSHQVSVRWFLRELHKFIVLVLDIQDFAPSLETLQGDALENLLGILNFGVPVLWSLKKCLLVSEWYFIACSAG